MIFEQIATGGCQSYLVGCEATRSAVLIDPEFSQIDRYLGLVSQLGLHVRYVVDTHTHADHFSGSRELGKALGAPVVMNRLSPAPFADIRLDDGSDNRLAGFHTIDERRLQALDGSALEQLSRDGHLLPAYMVLASLSRFRDLIERMNRRRAAGR